MSREEIEVLLKLDGFRYESIKFYISECPALKTPDPDNFHYCDNPSGKVYYYLLHRYTQVVLPCKEHACHYEAGFGWQRL